jgi:hypothetical protein
MSVVLATGDPVGTEGVVAISNLERQLGFLARIAVDSVKAAVLRKAPGYTLKYFCDRSHVEKTMVWCHQRRCSRRYGSGSSCKNWNGQSQERGHYYVQRSSLLGEADRHTCESAAAGGWKHDLSRYETAEIAVKCPWS